MLTAPYATTWSPPTSLPYPHSPNHTDLTLDPMLPPKLLGVFAIVANSCHRSQHKFVDYEYHLADQNSISYSCVKTSELEMSFTSTDVGAETSTSSVTAPKMQLGFSFAIAVEALHSKLALEHRKKCTQLVQDGDRPEFNCEEPVVDESRFVALQTQINEVQDQVQLWRASMGEMLERYERRKGEELAKLREQAATQVRVAQQQAEQQVECVMKLHATKVQELYDLFMQTQQQGQQLPLTEELVDSIQTRTNRELREVVDSQQKHIQQLQAYNFLSHLNEQTLEEEASRLKLTLTEKEDMITSLTTEFEGLIPKLHGYIDAREHLLTATLKENTRESFQQLELSLRNEQRENAWMKRALQENKRKRADRLSRLQQQVLDLTQALAERDDLIALLQRGFGSQSNHAFVPAQYHWQLQAAERSSLVGQ